FSLVFTVSMIPVTLLFLVFKGISDGNRLLLLVIGMTQLIVLLLFNKSLLIMTQGLYFPFSFPLAGSKSTNAISNCFTIVLYQQIHRSLFLFHHIFRLDGKNLVFHL